MKYKLLKLLEPEYKSISVWSIFVPIWEFVSMDNWLKLPAELLIKQGFIEEVKETPKPNFTVGQWVVCDCRGWEIKYLQIHELSWDWKGGYVYNRYFSEKDLRDPTPEELSIYFR